MAQFVKTLTNATNTDEILPNTIATAVAMVSTAKTVEQEIIDLKANKVTVAVGKGLSTEDFTTVEKNKLSILSNSAADITNVPFNTLISTNVQAAINELETKLISKVDKIQEDWSEAALLNGASGSIKYKKTGDNIVFIKLNITIGTGTINTILAELPLGYRLYELLDRSIIPCSNTTTNTVSNLYIEGDGKIRLKQAITSGNNIRGSICYIGDQN